MDDTRPPESDPQSELDELRHRLAEAEDTLRAIRAGEVDAVVVYENSVPRVYTLQGADHAYRVTLDEMSEGAVTLDSDGTILYCNSRFAAMSGVPRSSLLGTAVSACLDAARIEALAGLSRRENKAVRTEATLRPVEGEAIPVLLSMARLSAYEGDAFCLLVTDITERKRLEQDLAIERDQLGERTVALRALVSQLAVMEETERSSLALALHDDLGQLLVAIKMKLPEAGEEPAETTCSSILQEIGPLLAEAIEATRTLTRELSPPSLHTQGLAAALDELCESSARRSGLTVTLVDDGSVPPGRLPLPTRMILFRGVRELLFNVHKHSGVTHATVSLRSVDGELRVSVEDEGCGFDPKAAAACARSGQCFGLFSIAERIEDAGGRLEIDGAPGQGARITMVVDGGPV